ncbi:5'/3'-nucleotidase SurE [Bacteroidales bacterium OttesenSCG-928-A17]|nr:5'/3'-nucleotidase SurE [Bacteroidales bacterium OttesenSCG-928-A17]
MTAKKRPLILISNDDGVQALGINQLIESARSLGDLLVVAPDGPRSGMSSAITSINPIRASLIKEEEGLTVWSCTGTPVDCIKLGINELADRKPDLVLSGINHGSNAAICVVYSGTMGAAIEGCIFGIPSLGISLTDHAHDADFSQAVKYGKMVAEKVLKEGLPEGICLNLNIPNTPEIKGLKVCTQTDGYWAKEFLLSNDPSGNPVYWLTGHFSNREPDNCNSDEWALSQGYAALVPIRIDMTAHSFLKDIKHWEE